MAATATLPGLTITREAHRYSLRALFHGEFAIRAAVVCRTVQGWDGPGRAAWVIELFVTPKGAPEFEVKPRDVFEGRGGPYNPYWVLSDGQCNEPRLCPFDDRRSPQKPSVRWTDGLWNAIARELAAFVGFDAVNDRVANLAPADNEPEDVRLVAEAVPPPGE